jgi:CRISPR-associated protein Csb2
MLDTDAPLSPGPSSAAYGSWLVFEQTDGQALPLTSAPGLIRAVRRALLCRLADPIPPSLSGHTPDGAPTRDRHLAIVPLADVGLPQSDGTLRGFALIPPGDLSEPDRLALSTALRRSRSDGSIDEFTILNLGEAGRWIVRHRAEPELERAALRPGRYLRPAARWVSVTPMLLDRFPKTRPGAGFRDLIAAACRRNGLPAPRHCANTFQPPLTGVPPAHDFALPGGRPTRPFSHMTLEFDTPIPGPILIGAGRHTGRGLFLPVG